MDKDEARELNREAKIDKYESDTNKQCNNIYNLLMNNNINSTFDEQFAINEMYRLNGVDLYDIPLSLYDTAKEVLEAMGLMI